MKLCDGAAMTHRRLLSTLAIAVLCAACSSAGSGDTGASANEGKTDTKTAVEQASDASTFCDLFTDRAAQREAKGEGGVQPGSTEAVPDGEAGWDQRIEITSELAAAAPAEYQDAGATYVDLVKARAELFAAHGYPATLAEIPAADTDAFIQDHIDEQQVANTFIEFAKTECEVA
jgi:hypothetical protein